MKKTDITEYILMIPFIFHWKIKEKLCSINQISDGSKMRLAAET
jgi:hypothetical protein